MTVAVDAVVYYRVSNATISITNVEDANRSTRLLAQTTLRNVLGTKNLSEILSDRENISHFMQVQRACRYNVSVVKKSRSVLIFEALLPCRPISACEYKVFHHSRVSTVKRFAGGIKQSAEGLAIKL